MKQIINTLLIWLSLHSLIVSGQELLPIKGQTKVPQPVIAIHTPRQTMATFIHAMNDIKRGDQTKIEIAIQTLNLSNVNPIVRKERGRDLAWILLEIIDRTREIKLQNIPDYETGDSYIFSRYLRGTIEISPNGRGEWLFSKYTMNDLPNIWEELSKQKKVIETTGDERTYLPISIRIKQKMPGILKNRVLMMEHWQWLFIFVLISIGVFADKVGALFLRLFVSRSKKRIYGNFADVSDNILRPFGLMAMAGVWWAGLNTLGLEDEILLVLLVAAKFLAGLSFVWGAYRLVDIFSAYFREKAKLTSSRLDDMLVPLFTKTAKIFVTVIGFVFVADTLNMNVSGLLAGLGIGGLAFAMAAKDVVANLFGSITVLVDRPFHSGDWVKIGDIEGTVETIGFRSTRVRTFYNSVISVPNSNLITAEVDNMGVRLYRRYRTHFAIAYETPAETIESFCAGLRELVKIHPLTRKDYYHVYLHEMGDSALNILVYIFFDVPDWGTELKARHKFLLDAIRLAKQLGVEFAYPTHTLYMQKTVENEKVGHPFEPSMPLKEAEAIGQKQAQQICEKMSK